MILWLVSLAQATYEHKKNKSVFIRRITVQKMPHSIKRQKLPYNGAPSAIDTTWFIIGKVYRDEKNGKKLTAPARKKATSMPPIDAMVVSMLGLVSLLKFSSVTSISRFGGLPTINNFDGT